MPASADGGEARFESFMHFEVDQQSDPERIEAIRAEPRAGPGRRARRGRGLARHARPGSSRARGSASAAPRRSTPTELAEAEAFLRWIADNHFTFLGYGCYDLIREKDGDQLRRVEGSALGLLRRQAEPSERDLAQLRSPAAGGAPPGARCRCR